MNPVIFLNRDRIGDLIEYINANNLIRRNSALNFKEKCKALKSNIRPDYMHSQVYLYIEILNLEIY